MRVSQDKFLALLQQEASYQAVLEQKRLLPRQLDGFARLVVRYPWQIVALAAAISAGLVEIGGKW
jgi:hypothetical protein